MKNYLMIFATTIGCLAAPIVKYDTNSLVVLKLFTGKTGQYTNNVEHVIISDNIGTYTNIIHPTNVANGFQNNPTHFKLGTSRTNIVARPQTDIDAEAAAAQSNMLAQAELTLRTEAKGSITNFLSDSIAMRATIMTLLDEINTLRGELNKAKTNFIGWTNAATLNNRTFNQARNAILNKIEDKSAD